MKQILLIACIALLSVFFSCSEETYDIVIKNGTIYDGHGGLPFQTDIGIRGDEIVGLAKNINCKECKILNADGLAVAPGFIDVHAHIEALPLIPDAASALHQGVTTVLGGPDGSSPLRLGDYLDSLTTLITGVNVAYLAGHNSIRAEVMGLENRLASPKEMSAMSDLATRMMMEGAFGLSTGLKYLPGAFSDLKEIVTLSKTVAQKGGIYTSHLREEGLGLIKSVQEAIDIAAGAGITVVLTHHKAVGKPMWGASSRTLAMVDSARMAGLDVRIDQYPYSASFTSLSILIPAWAMAGGRYEAFARRCEDPLLRDSIKNGIVFNLVNDRGGNDLSRVQFARFDWKPHLVGKTLADWAKEENMQPTMENGAELVMRAQLHRGASAIFHAMSDEDIVRIMRHPQTMIASDGRLTDYGKGFPHPRAYGTFPRVLGRYVREQGVLPLQEAIRKMTSMPADLLDLEDRGIIAENMKADIVIFNTTTIFDNADFVNPHQYPEGIIHVIVNGKMAVSDGLLMPDRHGTVLRGPAYQP